jgi:hypothetical protein
MRIGIDFDNTLITYDAVFHAAAMRLGLIGDGFKGGTKQSIRDHIRLLPDGEITWQRLQGHVYGKGIGEATMFAGVGEFLRRCRQSRLPVAIVSHKTEYGHYDPDRVNLRQAALSWMTAQGFFRDFGMSAEDVFFESTRDAKLQRIAVLACTHFIDDLEEVLTDPGFPPNVVRILFANGTETPCAAAYTPCRSWREIEEHVLDRA